jgi:DNA-binding NarL/FixJ family response regulator
LSTVRTHLLRIFAKLDVADRTRAVVTALERGLLGERWSPTFLGRCSDG